MATLHPAYLLRTPAAKHGVARSARDRIEALSRGEKALTTGLN